MRLRDQDATDPSQSVSGAAIAFADGKVTNQQLLAWMQNPVPASQLGSLPAFGCSRPVVDPALKICNGIQQNELGLLANCPFPDFPWVRVRPALVALSKQTTCYGCPVQPPTPANPVPAQASPSAGASLRFRLPSNCSTAYFDPIGCADSDRDRADGAATNARARAARARSATPLVRSARVVTAMHTLIVAGPNGAGILPSGGTGSNSSSSPQPTPTQYQAFGAGSRIAPSILALAAALVLVLVR